MYTSALVDAITAIRHVPNFKNIFCFFLKKQQPTIQIYDISSLLFLTPQSYYEVTLVFVEGGCVHIEMSDYLELIQGNHISIRFLISLHERL